MESGRPSRGSHGRRDGERCHGPLRSQESALAPHLAEQQCGTTTVSQPRLPCEKSAEAQDSSKDFSKDAVRRTAPVRHHHVRMAERLTSFGSCST